MDFKVELEKYKNDINVELEKYINKEECPEKILNSSVEYSLMASGKRIRPILMLATYKLFKDNYQVCFPFAVAQEMVHNFSLIHDDLPGIDNDDFRHGKPTNHKMFNESTAILAGDSLLNYAYMVLSKSLSDNKDIDIKVKCIQEFSSAVNDMIKGEYIDTESEGKNISFELLEYMHTNKTGALIRSSVRIGALLANASEYDLNQVTKYAENIGLAFQIKDDILSEIGDTSKTGKPVGNDAKNNKSTYVSKFGLEESKKILDKTIYEAIESIKSFNEKADFLKELALYIKVREK